MQPPTVQHVIGQEQTIARLKVALEAAWNDGSRLPHTLLVGPPGVGKSMLAALAGREMGVEVHERLGQVLENIQIVNGLLLQASNKDVIFIDEIHEMPSHAQTVLYRAMDEQRIFVRHYQNKTTAMPLSDYSLFAATTDKFSLLPPLLDRFKLILQLTYYDDEALAKIIQQRAKMMKLLVDEHVAMGIATRSKGTPRLAIRLLEACHRFSRSKGEAQITVEHFEETLILEGLDDLGLDPDEQRYLKFLAEKNGDPVRLFTAQSALGIPRRTIQANIEPFLLRENLIEATQQGRRITQRGLEHLDLGLKLKVVS